MYPSQTLKAEMTPQCTGVLLNCCCRKCRFLSQWDLLPPLSFSEVCFDDFKLVSVLI